MSVPGILGRLGPSLEEPPNLMSAECRGTSKAHKGLLEGITLWQYSLNPFAAGLRESSPGCVALVLRTKPDTE